MNENATKFEIKRYLFHNSQVVHISIIFSKQCDDITEQLLHNAFDSINEDSWKAKRKQAKNERYQQLLTIFEKNFSSRVSVARR